MTPTRDPEISNRIQSSSLYNADLAPTTAGRRTWKTYNYAALWVSMSVNILTYMLAASLIQGGMNWKQAVATVFLGNTIVLHPDALEFASRRPLRDSVSGARSRVIWSAWS